MLKVEFGDDLAAARYAADPQPYPERKVGIDFAD